MRFIRRHIYFIVLILFVVYWLPFLFVSSCSISRICSKADELPASEAVIIFGTLVGRDREISPLMRERLEAGIAVFQKGRAKKLVVSNMKNAAGVMAAYLNDRGIPRHAVEIDPEADKTPDTCRFERRKHPEGRSVIFVSSGFHLPRLLYQCRLEGVDGAAFPAENAGVENYEGDSLFTVITTRLYRYFREAALTWLAVLGIYS